MLLPLTTLYLRRVEQIRTAQLSYSTNGIYITIHSVDNVQRYAVRRTHKNVLELRGYSRRLIRYWARAFRFHETSSNFSVPSLVFLSCSELFAPSGGWGALFKASSFWASICTKFSSSLLQYLRL